MKTGPIKFNSERGTDGFIFFLTLAKLFIKRSELFLGFFYGHCYSGSDTRNHTSNNPQLIQERRKRCSLIIRQMENQKANEQYSMNWFYFFTMVCSAKDSAVVVS